MKYTCSPCSYETDDFGNMQKHKKSEKHNRKVTSVETSIPCPDSSNVSSTSTTSCTYKKIICEHCNATFARESGLTRHIKTCARAIEKKTSEKIKLQLIEKDTENEIKLLKARIEFLEKQLLTTSTENEFHKNELTKKDVIATIANKSVNALTYLATKHKDAPPLKKIDNNEAKKLLHYGKDLRLTDRIFYYFEKKKLYRFIGDIILKHYKKDDPSQQSIWNSDATRLTFLIKDIVGKKSEWITDRKGAKLRQLVIEPIINLVEELINEYSDKINKNNIYVKLDKEAKKNPSDISNNSDDSSDDSDNSDNFTCSDNSVSSDNSIEDSENKTDKTMNNTTQAINILEYISTKKMEDDISRYLSPRFNLNKI